MARKRTTKPHTRYAHLRVQPKKFRRKRGSYMMIKCARKHLGIPANEPTRAAYGRFDRRGCSYLGTDRRYHAF